jgi:hypothetical protein
VNWHFARTEHTIKMISALPDEALLAFFDYIDELEADPYKATKVSGVDDGIVRDGIFGDGRGMATVIIGQESREITLIQVSWLPSA